MIQLRILAPTGKFLLTGYQTNKEYAYHLWHLITAGGYYNLDNLTIFIFDYNIYISRKDFIYKLEKQEDNEDDNLYQLGEWKINHY